MRLSADLKRSVPFFSPRYVGHMASDLLLPGVIARIITTLYNPNNVAEEAAPATLDKELEVGLQLARMVGWATDPSATPCAYGHLTSGGTLANYQGLRNLTAAKFYGVALAAAVRSTPALLGAISARGEAIEGLDDWALANLSVDEIITLRADAMRSSAARLAPEARAGFGALVESERHESLGLFGFFTRHPDLAGARVLAPATAHYSWSKALKTLGWGVDMMGTVRTDRDMRMDVAHLRELLEESAHARVPVLCIVGVLGTTEFGTIDPLGAITDARDDARALGIDASIHVDAAWGGYLATIFRAEDGGLIERDALRKRFHYFPSQEVYDAFAALARADSITIDPHKLGYIPYAAGAYVARNRGLAEFVSHSAAYVFDARDEEEDPSDRMRHLGEYVLEGSKSGAATASAYVTHKVLPLNERGFGAILRHTIRSCEYFYDALGEWRERMSDRVKVTMPITPDTNLVCLVVNPAGNTSLAEMNAFGRSLFSQMSVELDASLQRRDFIASYTSLFAENLAPVRAQELLAELGIRPGALAPRPRGPYEDDHVYMLRHTLMNPWLMQENERGRNYIDRYLDHLEHLIDDATRRV